MRRPPIRIGSRSYTECEEGIFNIPLAELADLRLRDVPYYSQLKIDVQLDAPFFDITAEVMHAGGPDNEELSFSIKVGYAFPGEGTDSRTIAKYKRTRAFVRKVLRPIADLPGWSYGPDWMPFFQTEQGVYCIEALYRNYEPHENPRLADIAELLERTGAPLRSFRDTLVFVCHASEDKPFVDVLCSEMDNFSVPVWYDRREIRVGDSIVGRINEALGDMSHIVIVLSRSSATKPWVLKELSSGLMRQLSDASVRVLPVVLDECAIPPILSDVRYADCRRDRQTGIRELLAAIT